MNAVVISAAAKINWTLNVTGTDEKGYHLLDMLMQHITLYDCITLRKCEAGISVQSNLSWLPCDERNTAYKSAQLFFLSSGLTGGCTAFIKKNIPSGAGMGGGSADAAAVLLGLNRLYGEPFSFAELTELGLAVGADVPFMMQDSLCRAQGIGEKLEALPTPPPCTLLLLKHPRQNGPTKAIYSRFDTTGSMQKADAANFYQALCNRDWATARLCGGNMLYESACAEAPSVKDNLNFLFDQGALYAAMTGSGSAVFGVFENRSAALRAASEQSGNQYFVCETATAGIKVCALYPNTSI